MVPVDIWLDNLFAGKKLLMVTGKGGVGKSLISLWLALMAVHKGRNVCLLESSDQDQLSPMLGLSAVGHRLTAFSSQLSLMNLDAQQNFCDFLTLHLGAGHLVEKLFAQSIMRSFLQMIPGIAEVTLLGRLYYQAELDPDHSFDLIIYDGFSSGHFLKMLKTPDAIIDSGMVGPVVRQTKKVKEFLVRDHQAGVVLVSGLEALMLGESHEFLLKLRETPLTAPVACVLNRVALPIVKLPSDMCAYKDLRAFVDTHNRKAARHKEQLIRFCRDQPQMPIMMFPDFVNVAEPIDMSQAQRWKLFAQTRYGVENGK